MRTTYHEKLSELTIRLSQLCNLAGETMQTATQALLRANLDAADRVISDQDRLVAMTAQARQDAFDLLALQQPVAGDLRAIFTAIQIVGDIERMAALAAHVAKIARRRHPGCAPPDEVKGCFAEMGMVAVRMGNGARDVLLSNGSDEAARLRQQDDAMDDLHSQLLAILMDDWKHGVETAVDVALLGRFYERFSDHAVEIGRRVVFSATGTLPDEQEVSTY